MFFLTSDIFSISDFTLALLVDFKIRVENYFNIPDSLCILLNTNKLKNPYITKIIKCNEFPYNYAINISHVHLY